MGNLSPRATEEQVTKLFELAGIVKGVQIARHPDGTSRGCAVLEFDSEENADIAIDVFDGRQHLGRTLTVRAFGQSRVGGEHLRGGFDAPRVAHQGKRSRRPFAHAGAGRSELHEKAGEDWRRLRGTKRRV